MAVVIAGYKFIDHRRCHVQESTALARCAGDRLNIVLAQDLQAEHRGDRSGPGARPSLIGLRSVAT
jgi:hypothetical protein